MQDLPSFAHPDLLIGAEQFSDAGVYRLRDDLAIVQSADFISPLVDDPFIFGQIAAANSMSDVFAIGATAVTALNLVCFPDHQEDLAVLNRILAGGAERVAEAGAVILGGHSVRDDEIKYGLAVTGTVDPTRLMSNAGAKPGDALVLTKGLGTGYITTAHRFETCPAATLEAVCASMLRLNLDAARIASELGVTGCTDITGFGLAGHAWELAHASHVSVHLNVSDLPLIPGARDLATDANLTRANATNRAHVDPETTIASDADPALLGFVFDPQTSGGLLLAIAADRADELVSRCRDAGDAAATIVGEVRDRDAFALHLDG